jgi:N6-L-threonylcarbamoyladenine synthase
LRQRLNELQRKQGYRVYIPKIEYCTDNGAMVAMVGYMRMKERLFSSLELAAEPNLSLEATTGSP